MLSVSFFFANFAARMKKTMSIALSILFLMSTVGLNVGAHYCCGEFIGVVVNGMKIAVVSSMPDCMEEDNGCSGCHTIHHEYKITSQYVQGSSVSLHPVVTDCQTLVMPIPEILTISLAVEEGGSREPWLYQSPYHSCESLPHSGLRAPPAQA